MLRSYSWEVPSLSIELTQLLSLHARFAGMSLFMAEYRCIYCMQEPKETQSVASSVRCHQLKAGAWDKT